MDNFENEIINNGFENNIKTWKMYVNDIFLIWPGTDIDSQINYYLI